jgi:hypothetical protein
MNVKNVSYLSFDICDLVKIKHDNMNQMIGLKKICAPIFEAICRFTKVERIFLTWKK